MDNETIAKLLPYLLSALAPVLVGLLQQMSKTVSEKAPWYLKSILTMLIGAAITYLTSMATGLPASMAGGAVIAAAGSANIALRKGFDRSVLDA